MESTAQSGKRNSDLGSMGTDPNYRKKEFEREIPLLNLPWEQPSISGQAGQRERVSVSLSKTQIEDAPNLCAGEQLSSFELLLAVFQLLLFRCTGQKEIVVGCSLGHTVSGTEQAMESWADIVPIITDFGDNLTFRELLTKV